MRCFRSDPGPAGISAADLGIGEGIRKSRRRRKRSVDTNRGKRALKDFEAESHGLLSKLIVDIAFAHDDEGPSLKSSDRSRDDITSSKAGTLESTSTENSVRYMVFDEPHSSFSQHRLVPRAPVSGNGPLIIGATVGGLSFVSILIVAIVIWRRRLQAKMQHQPDAGVHDGPGPVISSPVILEEDKLTDIGGSYNREPGSIHGTATSRSSSVNNRARSPINKSQIRHESWIQGENPLGNPMPPPLAQVGSSRIPSRATTPLSTMSSPTSVSKKTKRSSSILQRFGSRDLTSPVSIQSLSSNRGPPPPRPPRPEETEEGDGLHTQIFELSASPSVRKKRSSKPLPMLPTFLVREHEEEMKRRREELEREKREQYEKLRRPQSPVEESSKLTRSPAPQSSGSKDTIGKNGASSQLGVPEEPALKKVLSLDSLASTTTTSSSSSSDGEPSGDLRRPSPEVNPLSPRSSQRKPARRDSQLRAPIPSFPSTGNESDATVGDSLIKRTSYLVADGSSGVEATAVAPGFPSPKFGGPLRLTPPPPSRTSTPGSNGSGLVSITAPVSATVPTPPALPPPGLQMRDESPGHTSLHRTESTNSGGVAASGDHRSDQETFLVPSESQSERGLTFSAIEDWRESVGESYAATRPTTAGAASMGMESMEDVNATPSAAPSIPVVVEPARPTVHLQRRISVDTGVGALFSPLPPPRASWALLTPSTATTPNTLSPCTPVEKLPISAISPPSQGRERELLRPSTMERERELRKEAERTENAEKITKRKSVAGTSTNDGVKSWLNMGDDSDSDEHIPPFDGPTIKQPSG
ncbi:hypothetical protein BDZ91DRAFT_760397 [Kalaharituber pfeilii]|nr:hypothetical protein BDZ91DRAFT_760397 [Kalaharituber pfeilii]